MEAKDKKLVEVQRTGKAFVAALYGYLPMLDMTNRTQADAGHAALNLVESIGKHVAMLEQATHCTSPLPGEAQPEQGSEVPAALTADEEATLKELIQVHGVYVGQDTDTQEYIITHPAIQGRAHALNKRELYEIVVDLDERLKGELQ